MIRVIFWGTRGSFTCPSKSNRKYGANTPCVEVIGSSTGHPGAFGPGAQRLILDCGTGLLNQQRTVMSGPAGRGEGELVIFLSHFHWDHMIALPFYAPIHTSGNRVRIFGPGVDEAAESVDRLFSSEYSPIGGMANVSANLELGEVPEEGIQVGDFNLYHCECNHSTTTYSYRAEFGRNSLVYSTDHEIGDEAVDARLHEFAKGADLWIMDAPDPPDPDRQRWGHSDYVEAIGEATAAGVKTVALFHHSPESDDACMDAIARDAQHLAAGTGTEVIVTRDGQIVELGRSE